MSATAHQAVEPYTSQWWCVSPSFASSPWMRGAPRRTFSWLIRRMSARISAAMAGRPGRCRPCHHCRWYRHPCRRQHRTVSGCTIVRASGQRDHRVESMIQPTFESSFGITLNFDGAWHRLKVHRPGAGVRGVDERSASCPADALALPTAAGPPRWGACGGTPCGPWGGGWAPGDRAAFPRVLPSFGAPAARPADTPAGRSGTHRAAPPSGWAFPARAAPRPPGSWPRCSATRPPAVRCRRAAARYLRAAGPPTPGSPAPTAARAAPAGGALRSPPGSAT
jgi:hypothetical protein